MKRRLAHVFTTHARAGVCAAFDQRRDHGRVGIEVRRVMKRRHAVFGARVGVRTAFDQRRNNGRVGIGQQILHPVLHIGYLVFGERAAFALHFDRRRPRGRVGFVHHRQMKRRISPSIARAGVRTAFNQCRDHGRVGSTRRRRVKRRAAYGAGARAGVRTAFDQCRYHGWVAIVPRRHVKRRCSVVFVARAGVRAGSKRGLYFGSGSVLRRLEQIVCRVGMNGKRRQRQGAAKHDQGKQAVHYGVPFKVRLDGARRLLGHPPARRNIRTASKLASLEARFTPAPPRTSQAVRFAPVRIRPAPAWAARAHRRHTDARLSVSNGWPSAGTGRT